MQWTEEKEVLTMREVLGQTILIHKPGSPERGQGWQKVADTLNNIDGFNVSGRAIRDKITALIKKFKVLINKEKSETGQGGEEPTEYLVLIEEIINIHEDTIQRVEQATNEATEKDKQDREAALDVRLTAMESMGQTAERKKKGKERAPKRSGSETMDFLREKLEMDRQNKQMEREAQANQTMLMANLINTQQQMMAQQMAIFQELMNKKNKDKD